MLMRIFLLGWWGALTQFCKYCGCHQEMHVRSGADCAVCECPKFQRWWWW